MKKLKHILLLFLAFLFTSCEEVVEVELGESKPRLVIEASIIWEKGTTGTEQTIRLSETTPFYAEEMNYVETATIIITSEAGEQFEFIHTENGKYINEACAN